MKTATNECLPNPTMVIDLTVQEARNLAEVLCNKELDGPGLSFELYYCEGVGPTTHVVFGEERFDITDYPEEATENE